MHRFRRIARICARFAIAVTLLTSPVQAQSLCPVLDLTGPMRGDALSPYVGAFEDVEGTRTAADLANPDAVDFGKHYGKFPDFGYTSSNIWLRLCLRNRTKTSDWRLYIHENFFQVFDVHIARLDGSFSTLVKMDPDSPFKARVLTDPELVVPFSVAPNEQITLLIRYRSGGASQMDFSLETMESFNQSATRRTAKNFIFYGMMLLLITISLGSLVVLHHTVFLAYACYAVSILLFLMHGDGTAFQYIWPDLPALNSNASILTGGALIVFGSVYARVFLRTRTRHPAIDKLLWVIVVLTPVLIATLFVPNPQLLKKLLIMLSLLSILVFTGAGLYSYLSGHKDVRFYTLAWVGALFSSGLMNLRHVVGIEIPQETVHDSIRVVMVLDATMMGLAIADRYNQLRRGRQAALEDNLVATRQRLDLNRRLADLQARHDLAVELARSRDRDIQNVVHDLRQPLHALRLNVMNLTAESTAQNSAASPQNVETAFTYLETLIADHLESDSPETDQPPNTELPAEQAVNQDESLDQPYLQEILAAVADMFQPDAEAKGLYLRHAFSRIDLPVTRALILTRIVSNLVSNAIKYTDSGGILIATRRRGDTVRVEIHDTGPGMSGFEFTQATKRNVRLKRSRKKAGGKGLGLAIAIELADLNGMRLEHLGYRQQGTGIVLVLPV